MTNYGIDARMVFDQNGQHLGDVPTQLAQKVSQSYVDNALILKADKSSLPASAFKFKGNTTYASLPSSSNTIGDQYYVTDQSVFYAWNGTSWYNLGSQGSSIYASKDDVASVSGSKTINRSDLSWSAGFVNADGTYNSTAGYDKAVITVTGYTQIKIYTGYSYSSSYTCCFYDTNGTFISNIGTYTAGQFVTINIPSNAVTFRYFCTDAYYADPNTQYFYLYNNTGTNLYKQSGDISALQTSISNLPTTYASKNDIATINGSNNVASSSLTWSDGFVNADGTYNSTSGYKKAKITVNGYNQIKFYTGYNYSSNYTCCFYDSSNNFISNIGSLTAGQFVTINIPSNAYYFMYFCTTTYYTDPNNQTFYLYITSGNNLSTLSNSVSQLQTSLAAINMETVTGDHAIAQSSLTWTDGFVNADGTSNSISGYKKATITVTGYAKIKFYAGYGYNTNYTCCFYDTNGIFISNIGSYAAGQFITIDIPSNAKTFQYFCTSTYYTDPNLATFHLILAGVNLDMLDVRVSSLETVNAKNIPLYSSNVNKPLTLNGKAGLFFGDSITQGVSTGGATTTNNWVNKFAAKYSMTVNNQGASGATIATAQANSILTKVQNYSGAAADFVFIAGGTNDYGTGVTIGNYTDTDTTKFYGALNNLCSTLKSKFPSAQIIFITPINRLDSPTGTVDYFNNYRNAVSEKALENGFSVVNGGSFSFPSKIGGLSALLYADNANLHPTELGYSVYANNLADILA